MAIEPKTVTIDGFRYAFSPLFAKAGMRLWTEIAQKLGGSLAGGALGGVDVKDTKALGGQLIGALCAQLDPDFVERVSDTLARQCRVDLPADGGVTTVALFDIFDAHFAGRTKAQFMWIKFCLEAQYSDFLGLLTQLISSGAVARALKAKE